MTNAHNQNQMMMTQISNQISMENDTVLELTEAHQIRTVEATESRIKFLKAFKSCVPHFKPCCAFRFGNFLLQAEYETASKVYTYAIILESESIQVGWLCASAMTAEEIESCLNRCEAHLEHLQDRGLPLHQGWDMQKKVSFRPRPEICRCQMDPVSA